jgi:hypothetical protein
MHLKEIISGDVEWIRAAQDMVPRLWILGKTCFIKVGKFLDNPNKCCLLN